MTKKIQYQYDVFDRRIGRKLDADGNGTYESATYWVYDDAGKRDPNTRTALDDIVLEFTDADGDGSGTATLATRYLHGPLFDQILASEATSGNIITWALADHQGTIRDLARYSSGTTTIVNHRKFDAFGNVTAESDSTIKFLYSYTGREWDADAALYYYRARWYDARIGRFISEDPMGFAARDTNVNRYVGNNPSNETDASGLFADIRIADGRIIFSGTEENVCRMMPIWTELKNRATSNPELREVLAEIQGSRRTVPVVLFVLDSVPSADIDNFFDARIDITDLEKLPTNDGPNTQQIEALLHSLYEQHWITERGLNRTGETLLDAHAAALASEATIDNWTRLDLKGRLNLTPESQGELNEILGANPKKFTLAPLVYRNGEEINYTYMIFRAGAYVVELPVMVETPPPLNVP